MDGLLLDTNVWLDYLIPDSPNHGPAFQLVHTASQLEYPLLICSHSASDIFYIYQSRLKQQAGKRKTDNAAVIRSAAWAVLELLDEHATVVASDASDAWLARKMRSIHDDYEDNLVLAAAMRAKPKYLVTNDQALIDHANVASCTPERAMKFLQMEEG